MSYFTISGELLYKQCVVSYFTNNQVSYFTRNQVYEPAVARTRDMAVAQRRSVVQQTLNPKP